MHGAPSVDKGQPTQAFVPPTYPCANEDPQRRRLGSSASGITRHQATRIDHMWTYDFVKDQTADGRPIKILTVVDEFTRECLACEVARSITGRGVIGGWPCCPPVWHLYEAGSQQGMTADGCRWVNFPQVQSVGR